MIRKDVGVVGIGVGLLGSALEKPLRIVHDELIQRRGRCHENRKRGSTPAARPAGLLPE